MSRSSSPAAEAVGVAVSLSGLTRRFGTLTAVDGLTFDVATGELFGIVGPDGAGKTTTLRMLAGVLPPSDGTALVEGVDVGVEPEAAKPRLAYMAQRFGLYGDLTVQENLDFYADLYRVPKVDRPERLDRLYRFSRLDEFKGRLAGKLSGGMKQKLALSCCLTHHPRVLLLDEPTFGVDPISRRDLWLILHEMVGEGITVVVSTSYLDEAERCDRVVLLDQGRPLAMDRPQALQRSLRGTMVSLQVERPREARDILKGMPGVESATLFGETVHMLIEEGVDQATPLQALADAGLAVRESEEMAPSLEDVFIHLVTAPDQGAASHA
ncbi:MAG: ABC transporter ATP-binding protein [Gemmatimonadota bacterium]